METKRKGPSHPLQSLQHELQVCMRSTNRAEIILTPNVQDPLPPGAAYQANANPRCFPVHKSNNARAQHRKLCSASHQSKVNAKERVISNNYFRFVTPGHNSYDELEEIYWNGTVDRTENPIYGADVQGTLIGGILFPNINVSTRYS